MTATVLYTDTDKIRSALGLDTNDVKDDLIVNAQLDLELTVDLNEWRPDHAAIQTAGTGVSPTPEEEEKWTLLQLYSKWYCAWRLSCKTPIFVQIFGDGKAQLNRFDIDLEELKDMAKGNVDRYKGLLTEASGEEVTFTSFNPVTSSTPDFDPITGDGG